MVKTVLKALAGIVVLIVVALAGFLYTFDANNYKQEISRVAESMTGRSMTIAGDMDISLYPWIGVKIHDVTVANPDGFSNQTFASVGQFDVRVKLMPLLQKRLEIDRLVLHDLDVAFEKNQAGDNNWSDVSAVSESETAKSAYGLGELTLGGIDIKNSRISWLDKSTGKHVSISKMNLVTQAISAGQPLPVDFKAYVKSNLPRYQAAVKATAKLDLSTGTDVVSADGLKLVVKALVPEQQMEKFAFAMIADTDINLAAQTARLNKARFSTLGQVFTGTFDIENLFSVPVIHGPLKLKKFDMNKLAQHLKFDVPKMSDAQAFQKVSLEAAFKTDFDTIRLDDVSAKIDQSSVKGFVHIATAPVSKIRYELEADKLDLNAYRRVNSETGGEEITIPLEFIRSTDLDGVLDIASLTIGDSEFSDVHVASNIDNGMVKANPVKMQARGGEVTAVLQYDARNSPVAAMAVKVNGVEAAQSVNPLLEHILGDESLQLGGKVNADADIKASGASIAALQKSAKGVIKVDMNKVTVKGVDFDHASRSVVLDYAKRNDFRVSRTFQTEYDVDSATEFKRLSATFKLANGKLQNKDLSLVSDQLDVTGKGSIDFSGGKIDYRPVIDMKVANTTNIRDKLRDHPMQYHAHGRLGEVACVFEQEKFDLWVGRLMIQEAKAHRNRRLNSKDKNAWQNAVSKQRSK